MIKRTHVIGCAVAALLAVCAVPAVAQTTAIGGIRGEFGDLSKSVLSAAEKAPESMYGYQPTPEVFTYRKMLLHIADASYSICAGFQGTRERPKVDVEAAAAKAEVVKTLTASFAFCDAAMAKATDATLGEEVKAPSGTTRPKSYYLSHLLSHTGLHYGNVVTYLRMNKLAP